MNKLAALIQWQPLVICGKGAVQIDPATGSAINQCHYADLIQLAVNLINDLILISTVLATISFIYAGFKLITSGGNEGEMRDAKDMLLKVVIGYLVILLAWILVYTISNVLLNSGYSLLGSPR